jgi:hypothetical protein
MHCEFRSKSIKDTTVASASSASSTEQAHNAAPLPAVDLVDDAPVDSGDID